MDIFLVVAVLTFLGLNWYASRQCLRDSLVSTRQRFAQLAFVWLIPLLGALIVIAISRNTPEPSCGRYREDPDVGDQYVTGLGRLNDRGYIRSPDENFHSMAGHEGAPD